MQHGEGNNFVLGIDENTDILFEMCRFITNIRPVHFYDNAGRKSSEFNLRMSQSSFTLTSDKNIKIIFFQNTMQVSWKLWKTTFVLNSYGTMSSNKNFTKNLDRIITISPQGPFPGTVSETQYASGN